MMSYMEVSSWQRLGRALEYYVSVGFEYIEVPWTTSPKTSAITKPEHCKDYPFGKHHVLVASAEQSFIDLYDLCKSTEKIYVALTPCFRDEDYIDRYHQNYFHKVEIFCTDISKFSHIIAIVQGFMEKELNTALYRTKHKPGQALNIDLMLDEIELGSYGLRQHGEKHWVYATGLAEPRFSEALKYLQDGRD